MPSRNAGALGESRHHLTLLIYGIQPVIEALRTKEVRRLLIAKGSRAATERGPLAEALETFRPKPEIVDRRQLDELTEGGVHQGVVAMLPPTKVHELDKLIASSLAPGGERLLVALDGVQDPRNLGAIARSAYALGASGLIVPKDRSAAISGAAFKASAGALAHLKVAEVTNLSRALKEAKDAGFWTVAALPGDGPDASALDMTMPVVLVVGGEGGGVRPGVAKQCDFRARIPMRPGVDSLNASVSAAILLYEIQRQRSLTSTTGPVNRPPDF